ncbi:hypothetical protein [Brevibacillus fortis]|uniref:Uncharacterized protein n=1 Tax=Brevibacillus fortis TaxID=2126352 RepID=A0A2P7UER8_9BACL|nr:hypothetical protein [Brevibacillus fortis]PSJ85465.1 hypothetical protein C7R93_29850 [Brevibacillus fortis]
MDSMEQEFESRAIVRHNLLLFTALDAITVIKRCEELKKKIHGIDAFRLKEQYIQPVMEESIDYSNTPDNWADAVQFIKTRLNKNLVFEIVYD